MQLSFYILFFHILLCNSLFALLKNQSTKEEERSQLLKNVNERLRLKFTSEDNFRKFQLFEKDASIDNIPFMTNFISIALKDGTMTEEEALIFYDHIKHVHKMRKIEDARMEYIDQKRDLEDRIFIEKEAMWNAEVKKKMELEEIRREKERQNSMTSRMFSWFWPFVRDKNKESVVQEEQAAVKESMVQEEEQVELRESELLAEEMEEVTTSSSGIVSLIKKK